MAGRSSFLVELTLTLESRHKFDGAAPSGLGPSYSLSYLLFRTLRQSTDLTRESFTFLSDRPLRGGRLGGVIVVGFLGLMGLVTALGDDRVSTLRYEIGQKVK